jgi:hypothetical protein
LKGRFGFAEPFSLITEESHSQKEVVKGKSSVGASATKHAGEVKRLSGMFGC